MSGSLNPASAGVVVVTVSLLLLCGLGRDVLAEESPTTPSGSVVAVPERGEVHIASRFVNPSRILEVFACHRSGPTHETVLEFDATGPEIARALEAIGCRGASAWNITGPEDFEKTQGDRLLAIVRWEDGGVAREYPAEGLLNDGDFGFPAFVRGFSYGARRARPEPAPPAEEGDGDGSAEARDGAPAEDRDSAADETVEPGGDSLDPDRGDVPSREESFGSAIPEVCEITLGGTLRRSATHSLLWHATTSSRLRRWMLPPIVNTDVVESLAELASRRTPATLVLRRIRSEREWIDYLRSVAVLRKLESRLGLYDALLPLATSIDEKKSELRAIAAKIETLLAKAEPAAADVSGAETRARETLRLLARGRVIVEEIEWTYLRIYALQEEFKLEWLKREESVPPPLREEATVLARDGFLFEPKMAERRAAMARLDERGVAPDAPQWTALAKEIEVLVHSRDVRIAQGNRRYVESRLAELEDEDGYLRELFEGDRYRIDAQIRTIAADRDLAQCDVDEARAKIEGTAAASAGAIASRRRDAERRSELGKAELEFADVLEELRWAKNDLESQLKSRREKAETDLAKFSLRKKELEAKIARLKANLESAR